MCDNKDVQDDRTWVASYDAYVTFCLEAVKVDPKFDRPTFEEWQESILGDNPHKEIGLKASFRTPPNLTGLGFTAAGMAARGMGIDTSSPEAAIKSAANKLRAEFTRQRAGRGAGTFTADGPGDGGTTRSNYSGGSPYNPTGLSLNARPIESSWTTPIKVNYQPKYFLDGRDDSAPLILKQFTPVFGTDVDGRDSRLESYFSSKIVADWISQFQMLGRWNSTTQGFFTAGNVKYYMNMIAQGLSIFYFYNSIIAHYNLEINRNEAMVKLYEDLNPNELNQIFILRNTLNRLPIPPELNAMCFKLFNNYKQSYNPGAPLMKFCPISGTSNENYVGFLTSTKIFAWLEGVQSDTFRNMQAIVAQTKPDWATNVKVFDYTGLPNHDNDFTTLFTNSLYICRNSLLTLRVPSVNNFQDDFVYNIHTDAPDGWTQALSNCYVINSTQQTPGIGGPKTVTNTTTGLVGDLVWSYNDNGVKSTSCVIYTRDTDSNGNEVLAAFPISRRTRYQALSGNTYSLLQSNLTPVGYQKFGTTRVLPVTGNTQYMLAQQLCDIIYAPGDLTARSGSSQSTPSYMKSSTSMGEEETSSKKKRRRKRK